ncbi:MAG: peptidylprolyl isomerase [Deltaproteobacteria bacterium]|nr:peptidylprolyl isomerase [Deltaproteobacteria bacterium]
MDRIAGRPASVPHCGLRLLDAATVAVHHAEVLATLADIPAFVRGDALLRLHRQGNARVRIAVLSAAASVDDPRLSEIAIEALLGRDEGLVASAAELLAAHPGRFRAADGAPRPEVVRALARALATPHLEARLSTIRAIEKVGDESLIGPLGPHLVSPNEEVRRAAAAAFRAIRRRDPPNATDATAPVPHLVSTEVIEAGRRSQALELETTRGRVRIVLENSAAPTTVARIVELAARGFYDGLTFHRVVPGFVVQGGDPRGDGYGGPGWDQRCEDRPDAPYVRGTVGMALAGRDTGGSQFFVTYGRQPHLDGGYTPFAHVESGMDVLERIVPGDVITRVRVIPR